MDAKRLHSGGHSPEILVVILSAFGSGAKYMYDIGKNKDPFKFTKLLIRIITGIVVGISGYHALLGIGAGHSLALGFSHLCAITGFESSEWAWNTFKRWVNDKLPPL